VIPGPTRLDLSHGCVDHCGNAVLIVGMYMLLNKRFVLRRTGITDMYRISDYMFPERSKPLRIPLGPVYVYLAEGNPSAADSSCPGGGGGVHGYLGGLKLLTELVNVPYRIARTKIM
jgi:hypothetical protein